MDYKDTVVLDIECYKNYLLLMFKHVVTGKILYFQSFGKENTIPRQDVIHILNKYRVVTFNGIGYDSVIMNLACSGVSLSLIKKASDMIIVDNRQPWEIRQEFGVEELGFDHIDIINVSPGQGSLKIYGGRARSDRMKDLPIEPDQLIKEEDISEMRIYCENDLNLTIDVLMLLEQELDLRCKMSEEYQVDLRSKSDAQIAEAVIKHEMRKKYNITPKAPVIEVGTEMYYTAPDSLHFKTDALNTILNQFTTLPYEIGTTGHAKYVSRTPIVDDDMEVRLNKKGQPVFQPHPLNKPQVTIGETCYTLGLGGIHSNEKSVSYQAGEWEYAEIDVAAYYPNIILENKLAPKHLGNAFLTIFRSLVERRLKAKREKDSAVNESLKITINGTFGKLGSKWSVLYAPDLMAQVTITGQLTLLMLIERLELEGISVVSGNTDGIVVRMSKTDRQNVHDIVEQWEFETGYDMEYSEYLGLYSRDINNYIAVGKHGIKGKGVFADPRVRPNMLRKNPVNEICVIAVKAFLQNGDLIEDTVRECYDITKFVTARAVRGGALYDGKLVGKAIRWYYSDTELDSMYYKTSGNKVPRSDGAKPIMDLPDEMPEDLDYKWYINEAINLLESLGYDGEVV